MKLLISIFILLLVFFLGYLCFTNYFLFIFSLEIFLLSLAIGFAVSQIRKIQGELTILQYIFWTLVSLIPAILILSGSTYLFKGTLQYNEYYGSIVRTFGYLSVLGIMLLVGFILFVSERVTSLDRQKSRKLGLFILFSSFAIFFSLSISILNWFSPPINVATVSYKANYIITDSNEYSVTEDYLISMNPDFSFVGIKQIENNLIKESDIKNYSKFEDAESKDKQVENIKLTIERKDSIKKRDIGFIQGVNIIAPTDLTLIVKNKQDDGDIGVIDISKLRKASVEMEVQMPKNSILATYPKSEIISLPDKDVFAAKQENFSKELEIYYIKQNSLRLSLIKSFLSSDSYFDYVIKILQFLFLPIILFFIAAFREKIQNFIVELFKKKEKKREIGFKPKPKEK